MIQLWANLSVPTVVETHCCVRAVFHCRRCDLLSVPPSMMMADQTVRTCGDWDVPFVITSHWSQFACYLCHLTVCGGWLAALFAALNPNHAPD